MAVALPGPPPISNIWREKPRPLPDESDVNIMTNSDPDDSNSVPPVSPVPLTIQAILGKKHKKIDSIICLIILTLLCKQYTNS